MREPPYEGYDTDRSPYEGCEKYNGIIVFFTFATLLVLYRDSRQHFLSSST
jgi:hypothetical protein